MNYHKITQEASGTDPEIVRCC